MQETLRRLFDYKNGGLVWKVKGFQGFSQTGLQAGTENKGYVWVITKQIEGRRKVYGLHRLVWIWHYGNIPEGYVVDHINRNTLNNSVENLRLATRSENSSNACGKSNKKSGLPKNVYVDHIYKGVTTYRAQVCKAGKYYRQGNFKTVADAENAAMQLRIEHHKEFAK